MLLSELQERERRFKLALRAGIPILLLISLVLYSTFFKAQAVLEFTLETGVLMAALLFITVYFIYFLMALSAEETLIDQTTQGFNQKAFVERLEKRKPKTLALFIIKNLSLIGQHYGDAEVDRILYTVMQKLNRTFHEKVKGDTLIGRRYGAEFIIALNENNENLEEILRTFAKENSEIHAIELDYQFAVVTNTGKDFRQIVFQLKDMLSMQRGANKKGKTSVTQNAKEVVALEKTIVDAIKKDRLALNFRPLLCTHTQVVEMYEIAVKLTPHLHDPILPRVYLPVVNRLGLGVEYDLALVKHIIDILPLLDERISLSFNLSPFSLRNPEFQKVFFAYMKEKKVEPLRLVIQLYERKTHHNIGGYLKTLNAFRAKGVRICIDNFGSSSASMEYMKHFKFDMVQFDRDYVTHLEDTTRYAMFESLCKMSKDLHIVTVAKWVDTPQQKEKLTHLGIDYLQGFGIGEPLDEQSLITKYNE